MIAWLNRPLSIRPWELLLCMLFADFLLRLALWVLS